MATSDSCAAETASGMPEASFDHSLHPSAKLILTEVLESSSVNPAKGLIPFRVALKKT